MDHAFYILSLIALVVELGYITIPSQMTSIFKGKETLLMLLLIFYVIGLVTFQWLFFLIHLVYLLILSQIDKQYEGTSSYNTYLFISAIPSLLFTIFVIVNKYHLHISSKYIINLF